MSLVHVGFRISDADGDTSSMSVKVPLAALTLAELVEFAQELAVLIDDSIDGIIQEITIQTSVSLPGGLQGAAVAGSEVQKGGLLSFTAAGTPYRWSVRVPALTPGKFTGITVKQGDEILIVAPGGGGFGSPLARPAEDVREDVREGLVSIESARLDYGVVIEEIDGMAQVVEDIRDQVRLPDPPPSPQARGR